jgi:hypothetical protein
MKRATRFMLETVSYRGAFLWAYCADFSRCWGELEARRSMLWVQPPGTPGVGHVLLDALHATGDDFYYEAALHVARALMGAQHPSGGWNYVHDLAGPDSLAEWYATIGCNAWRLEEFHRHPDNSTFDDSCTASAGSFLLRMAIERGDADCRAAFERVLDLLARSQYPSGGWPQRYPPRDDYTRFLTFNDNVIGDNIELLLMASSALGAPELAERARAAMDCMLALQQAGPECGWGLQHTADGAPASARSFEPRALVTHTSANNLCQLMNFYELTGDPKYLTRVADGLSWLERVQLPAPLALEAGGSHPTFIELGTAEPLYVHRRGSNVVNGAYYHDKVSAPRLSHYSSVRAIDVAALRQRLRVLSAESRAAVLSRAPLGRNRKDSKGSGTPAQLPRYFSLSASGSHHLAGSTPLGVARGDLTHAKRLIDGLTAAGAWLGPLEFTSNPYRGPGDARAFDGDTYASKHVGDRTDTSPYRPHEAPATYTPEPALLGVSVRTFIENLANLIAVIER